MCAAVKRMRKIISIKVQIMKSLASRSKNYNNNNNDNNSDRNKNIALIFAMACSCRYIYMHVSHRCTPNIFGYQRFSAFSYTLYAPSLVDRIRRSRSRNLQLAIALTSDT